MRRIAFTENVSATKKHIHATRSPAEYHSERVPNANGSSAITISGGITDVSFRGVNAELEHDKAFEAHCVRNLRLDDVRLSCF